MMQKESSKESVAQSLESSERLLPHMPFLLQDLWAMGASVPQILDIIEKSGLPGRGAAILDLGCGKGAVSIEIAGKFGFQVTGIDAMEDFLAEARQKSLERGVAELCRFVQEDILSYVAEAHFFDMVVLASLGGIFGAPKDMVRILRSQVKHGGYMLIDDGYLKTRNRLDRQGYKHYRNYEKTVRELTGFGDAIVDKVSTTEVNREINNQYLQWIGKRCPELIRHHPELEQDVNAYFALQQQECRVIDDEIEGIIWLIRKSSS